MHQASCLRGAFFVCRLGTRSINFCAATSPVRLVVKLRYELSTSCDGLWFVSYQPKENLAGLTGQWSSWVIGRNVVWICFQVSVIRLTREWFASFKNVSNNDLASLSETGRYVVERTTSIGPYGPTSQKTCPCHTELACTLLSCMDSVATRASRFSLLPYTHFVRSGRRHLSQERRWCPITFGCLLQSHVPLRFTSTSPSLFGGKMISFLEPLFPSKKQNDQILHAFQK